MKRNLLLVLFTFISLLLITGCDSKKEKNIEEKKEVTVNGAYILDYDDKNYLGDENKALMIVVMNIKPNKDILLDNISMKINIADKEIQGSKYSRADLVYDSYDSIESGHNGKIAYLFTMEKYLYKENDTFNIEYNIGTQKGEYSYIISDNQKIDKKTIKNVDLLEEIVKDVYKDNSEDALMILSLKWKLKDVYDRAKAYDGLSFYYKTNYQCFDMSARKNGNKILNYFAEGTENNVSISNRNYLNVGVDSPEITYNLPSFNYDTLEKYYPGIKEKLVELSQVTNDYANGLINVKESGEGECYRDLTINDIKSKAINVENLMK